MAQSTSGDVRVRRRATTIIEKAGVSFGGTYSERNQDLLWCDKHFITVQRYGVVTAGILSVRGLAVNAVVGNAGGTAKSSLIGLEGIDFTKVNNLVFEVNGFFQGFELVITSAVVGGTVSILVNSVDTFG